MMQHTALHTQAAAPMAAVESRIQMLRGQRVLLDADLAELYGVDTKRLNEQVKRNLSRFPSDFMFQLTTQERANLRSQIATSSSGSHGGRRTAPYAFTEQGVAMLSSVFDTLRQLMTPPTPPKRPIGFTADVNGAKP